MGGIKMKGKIIIILCIGVMFCVSGCGKSVASAPVTIAMETQSKDYNADDGTIVFTETTAYPVIAISGKEDVATKINTDIQNAVLSNSEMISELVSYAKEDYAYSLENADMEFYSYGSDVSMEVTRCDDKILSFTYHLWSYTGGAHGNYITNGMNYDLATGERLTFEEISDQPEQFHADALDYLTTLSKSEVYQAKMSGENSGDLEEILFAPDKWYFSNSGLTFISDPYVLGSYADGTIRFLIPYQDIIGLKDVYSYDGFFEREIPVGMEVNADLNGDSKNDLLYYKAAYNEDYSEISYVFQVNDTDFSDLIEMENPDMMEYYLVDLDHTDSYVEIALMDYGPSDDPMTYFYRYKEDGTITLLGYVSDFWTSDSCFLESNGTICATGRLALLQTWFAPFHWKLNDQTLSLQEEALYYPNIDTALRNNILNDFVAYQKMDINAETITMTPADGSVLFIATDNKNWVEFTTEDNRKLYLYLKDFSMVSSDGTYREATEVFDQLIIAD